MAQTEAKRDSRRGARWLAGLGLAGRGGFYLIVAALAIEIAVDRHPSQQANASGALALATRPVGGKALVAAIALALLVVSGVDYNPRQAAGMDGELAVLVRYPWGRKLLFLVAAGLVAFGMYSLLEARYRDLAIE